MRIIILISFLLALLSSFVNAATLTHAELSPSAKANEQDYVADIFVYADKAEVADKVATYLQDQGLNAMPINDPQMLGYEYLKNVQLVILMSLGGPKFPDNILLGLKNYVYKGGSIIGIHEVLFLQPLFSEIFGGSAGVVGYQQLKPEITITIRDRGYTYIMQDIPDSFALDKEHSLGTVYKPQVHRLFDETYTTTSGVQRKYCAGWTYDYGKGKAFYFSPGDKDETKCNPTVLKIISNTAGWMLQLKNESVAGKSFYPSVPNPKTPVENIPLSLAPSTTNNEYIKGKMDGSRIAKGDQNWALAGFFGPLGVLAAYTYPQEPPITYITNQTPEYVFGFTESYRSECKSKNGGYAVGGWLVTWLVLIVIAVASK